MPASEVTSSATVTIGGQAYTPISFEVSEDNNWTPSWSGNIVFDFHDGPQLSTPDRIPARITWTYDGFTMLDVLLLVRSVVMDDAAGTITLTVKSAEILLQDLKNVATADYQPGAMTMKAMWAYAFGKFSAGVLANNSDGVPNSTVAAAGTVWKGGQDLDSWLRPALRTADIDIYQDMIASVVTGVPTIATALLSNPGKELGWFARVRYGKEMLKAPIGWDLDSGDYADGIVAEYNWTDAAGAVKRKLYAKTQSASHWHDKYIRFDAGDPGFDPTPSLLTVAQRSGFTGSIECNPVMEYSTTDDTSEAYRLRLGATVDVVTQYRGAYIGTANRITWNYPADTMSIGLTDLEPRPNYIPW